MHRSTESDFEELVGRKGSYEKVYKGINNLTKYDVPFEISCMVDTKRIEIYFDLVRWAISEDIRTVVFLTYVPLAGASAATPNMLLPKESTEIVESLYTKLYRNPDIECHFVFQYPLCLLNKDIYESMSRHGVIFGSHELLYTGRALAIDPEGNILPGSHWVGFPLFHLDNIRENGSLSTKEFLTQWNSENSINFRKQLWYYPSEYCEKCELWANSCTGGNPLVWQVWQEKDLLPLQKSFGYPKEAAH